MHKVLIDCPYINLSGIAYSNIFGGRRHCRVCMVVGFTTIYAISAYHHRCCEFESRSGPPVSSSNKNDLYDKTERLLNVAINTIKQTNNLIFSIIRLQHFHILGNINKNVDIIKLCSMIQLLCTYFYLNLLDNEERNDTHHQFFFGHI